jgi:hypothetical protein
VTPVIAPARFGFADNTRCGRLASNQWSAGQPLDAGSRRRLYEPPQVLDEFLFVASSSKCLAPKDHAEVCQVTRTMMLSMKINSMVILIITIRRSLFPRSFTRPPVGLPYGRLSAANSLRRRSGLPRSASFTGSVRFCLDAGGSASTIEEVEASIPDHLPFGYSGSAACAAYGMTTRVRQFRCLNHTIRS